MYINGVFLQVQYILFTNLLSVRALDMHTDIAVAFTDLHIREEWTVNLACSVVTLREPFWFASLNCQR